MQFIGRRLQKFLSSMVGRFFALRIQNPVINQVREDSVEVKLIFVSGLNFAAGFIKPESIINGLSKKISALKESLLSIVQLSVCMKSDLDSLRFLLIFILFGFKSYLIFAQAITSSLVGPCSAINSFKLGNNRISIQ